MPIIQRPRVKETTTTTGTGTYSLGGAATGYQTFLAAIGNGGQCHYVCSDNTNWEVGVGTVASGTPNTLARTTILASSNGGAAVNWGGGTRDIFCDDCGYDRLIATNNLSDLAAPTTTARQNLGILPTGQSGGTDGKVVRLSAANIWVEASQADTAAQLGSVWFKAGGHYYPPGSIITGLSAIVAGTNYWLSTAGGLTSTPPTPSSTVRRIYVGMALTTTSILFQPGFPIGG